MNNPIIEQKEQENNENALYSEWFHENLDVNAENYAEYLVRHYEEEFKPALSFEDWCMIEAERLKHEDI